MSATAPATAPASTTSKYLPLIAMIFVTSMTFIDMTIVSIAAPEVEKGLGISDNAVQWVINGYLLALASLFALFGRIADVVGHKRMAIIGTIVFATASALCGFTPVGSFAAAWIITFRVIQGAGAAMLFPAALAIVASAFAIKERGRALALFFAITGAFTAIGPILGGYLVEWTWRSIFWINIPVAIIALILTSICKPTLVPKKEPIDWRGGAVIVAGMGLSVLGLQQASSWGWTSPATIGCVVVGLVLIGLFVKMESGQKNPLIKVWIFRDRAFVADNFVLFFSMMAFVPVFFFLSLYAQIVLGDSAQDAGLFIMWFFIGFVIAAQVGGAMLDRIGSKLPMMLGSLISAVGFAGLGFQATQMTSGAITPWIIAAGAGIGLLLGPASTDALNRAIGASYGEVTGITQTLRNYGSALGMAILGTIMLTQSQNRFVSTLTGFGLSNEQADTVAKGFSHASSGGAAGASSNIPTSVRDKILTAIQLDFSQAMKVVFLVMAGMLVVSFLVSLIHPGGKVVTADAEEEDATSTDTPGGDSRENVRRVLTYVVVAAVIYLMYKYL